MSAVTARIREALEVHAGVLEAYIFGSSVRGDAASHSDLDVAVYLDPGLAAIARRLLTLELATDLMAALGRNDIDLVCLNDATPLLYHRVLRDGARVFSRDPLATTTREGYALSRWCDWAPVQMRIDAVLQRRRLAREAGA